MTENLHAEPKTQAQKVLTTCVYALPVIWVEIYLGMISHEF